MMTATTALRPLASQGAPDRLVRGRGEAQRIVITVDDALAPCQSGVALCGEVVAAANRVYTAARNDALMTAAHEAGRLADLAARYRREFQRMAGEIDSGDDSDRAA